MMWVFVLVWVGLVWFGVVWFGLVGVKRSGVESLESYSTSVHTLPQGGELSSRKRWASDERVAR